MQGYVPEAECLPLLRNSLKLVVCLRVCQWWRNGAISPIPTISFFHALSTLTHSLSLTRSPTLFHSYKPHLIAYKKTLCSASLPVSTHTFVRWEGAARGWLEGKVAARSPQHPSQVLETSTRRGAFHDEQQRGPRLRVQSKGQGSGRPRARCARRPADALCGCTL